MVALVAIFGELWSISPWLSRLIHLSAAGARGGDEKLVARVLEHIGYLTEPLRLSGGPQNHLGVE